MEFQFHGANAIQINTKKAKVLVDPNGAKPPVKVDKKYDIVLATQERLAGDTADAFVIDGPGEYEVSSISVNGVAARGHMDEEGETNATIYKVMTSSVYAAVVGHIHPDLTDAQLEAVGTVDILIIPVGGNGYTLDATGAAKVVRAMEPKIVIPTHYAMKGVTYEVPQAELELFMKEIGAGEDHEKTDKYKVKGDLPEKMEVVELTKL